MPGQRPHSSQPWDDLDIFEPEPRRPDWRKPIIRVVCPVCAGIVSVNALEVEGATDTLCSKCENTTISIATDDRGRVVSIEGWANEVEKKAKQPDLKALGPYLAVILIVILLFAILLRQSVPSNLTPAVTTPPAAGKQPVAATAAEALRDTEDDLSKPATPTKDRLPFSEVLETPNNGRDKRANPPTGDMFAPEKN